jgi:hypothetical protein
MKAAERYLHISGEEFLLRWEAGEFGMIPIKIPQ